MPIVKSSRKRSLGYIALILVLGAFMGSVLGELVGLILPAGVVKEFFFTGVEGNVGPATINLVMFSFTLGFSFKINVIGVVGIATAAYLLRWY